MKSSGGEKAKIAEDTDTNLPPPLHLPAGILGDHLSSISSALSLLLACLPFVEQVMLASNSCMGPVGFAIKQAVVQTCSTTSGANTQNAECAIGHM